MVRIPAIINFNQINTLLSTKKAAKKFLFSTNDQAKNYYFKLINKNNKFKTVERIICSDFKTVENL